MSFILDALRKSENARQSLGSTSLAELPLGRRARSQPWWIFAIGALLLINLIVLVIVLLRGNLPRAISVSPSASASAPVSALARADSAPRVASAPATPSAATATRPLADVASPPQVRYESVDRNEVLAASNVPDGPALVKRIDPPAQPMGSVTTMEPTGLPELHVDMHVYANLPADRFVFINMRKYNEGEIIAEGPRVDEITVEGVTLSYKGQQLHLHRP